MIPILFENNDILAVNKPEGLATIPERDASQECLLHVLSEQCGKKLFIVHRLDKEVSGVILFAKNAEMHKYLNGLFEKRAVNKTYCALVHGIIEEESGVISKPIRQFGSGRMGVDERRGKECTTTFEVQQRFRDYTLVHVHPLTGRRHQIRVHFYSVGHPVVGDLHYGERSVQKDFPRLMLHAMSIELSLNSGINIRIEAPVPESFVIVLKKLMERLR
jgi:tRNA pseudouridine32 synthase / 23S rRNA pseudouridine746 synthase